MPAARGDSTSPQVRPGSPGHGRRCPGQPGATDHQPRAADHPAQRQLSETPAGIRSRAGWARWARRTGTQAPPEALRYAATLLVVSVAAYVVLGLVLPNKMADMLVYRAEGAAVVSGHDLYALRVTEWRLPATYPPVAALLFAPTSWIPIWLLKIVISSINVGLLAICFQLSFRLVGWPRPTARPAAVLAGTAGGIWLEPIYQTMHYGQINMLIVVLVLWDFSRAEGARGKGLAIGLATGIKLTPGLFAVYLLLAGRVRTAVQAAVGFLGTVLLAWLVLPDASVEYWTQRMFEARRVGRPWIVDNQSLRGLLARLLHTPRPGLVWMVTVALVSVIGVYLAARAARALGEPWGILCCAVTGLLISPISWSHHWVWCVPLLVLLAAEAATAARGAPVFLDAAGNNRAAPDGGGAGKGLNESDRWMGVKGAGGADPAVFWPARTSSDPRSPGQLPVGRWIVFMAVLALFLARTMWLVPKAGDLDLHLPWWQQPAAAPYPVFGLVFLAAMALRRRPSPGDFERYSSSAAALPEPSPTSSAPPSVAVPRPASAS